jgi:hypothetical protein
VEIIDSWKTEKMFFYLVTADGKTGTKFGISREVNEDKFKLQLRRLLVNPKMVVVLHMNSEESLTQLENDMKAIYWDKLEINSESGGSSEWIRDEIPLINIKVSVRKWVEQHFQTIPEPTQKDSHHFHIGKPRQVPQQVMINTDALKKQQCKNKSVWYDKHTRGSQFFCPNCQPTIKVIRKTPAIPATVVNISHAPEEQLKLQLHDKTWKESVPVEAKQRKQPIRWCTNKQKLEPHVTRSRPDECKTCRHSDYNYKYNHKRKQQDDCGEAVSEKQQVKKHKIDNEEPQEHITSQVITPLPLPLQLSAQPTPVDQVLEKQPVPVFQQLSTSEPSKLQSFSQLPCSHSPPPLPPLPLLPHQEKQSIFFHIREQKKITKNNGFHSQPTLQENNHASPIVVPVTCGKGNRVYFCKNADKQFPDHLAGSKDDCKTCRACRRQQKKRSDPSQVQFRQTNNQYDLPPHDIQESQRPNISIHVTVAYPQSHSVTHPPTTAPDVCAVQQISTSSIMESSPKKTLSQTTLKPHLVPINVNHVTTSNFCSQSPVMSPCATSVIMIPTPKPQLQPPSQPQAPPQLQQEKPLLIQQPMVGITKAQPALTPNSHRPLKKPKKEGYYQFRNTLQSQPAFHIRAR